MIAFLAESVPPAETPSIAVWLIVGVTVFAFAWRIWKTFSSCKAKGGKTGCGGGCDCGAKKL